MPLQHVYTQALGRTVALRPGTSDAQVHADTFGGAGGYHIPPSAGRMQPRVVVDAGANIGLTAAHYKRIWPHAHVVGIEPVWESYDLAVQNAPDCRMQWLALTDWVGVGTVDLDAEAQAATVVYSPRGVPALQAGQVHCTTVGAWVHANGPIDFLKLDVEGAEWGILRQAAEWMPNVEAVLVELHQADDAHYAVGLSGRDGPNPLIGGAANLLLAGGYRIRPHVPHPAAIWAWKP